MQFAMGKPLMLLHVLGIDLIGGWHVRTLSATRRQGEDLPPNSCLQPLRTAPLRDRPVFVSVERLIKISIGHVGAANHDDLSENR